MTSFQSSELTELPVVENSQLFAQRAHSACTAHGTPPKSHTVQGIVSKAKWCRKKNVSLCQVVWQRKEAEKSIRFYPL